MQHLSFYQDSYSKRVTTNSSNALTVTDSGWISASPYGTLVTEVITLVCTAISSQADAAVTTKTWQHLTRIDTVYAVSYFDPLILV